MKSASAAQRWLLWVLLALLLLGLAYFSYLGIYNRSYADDWCYNADFKELGLSQTLTGYSSNTTYAASRFSLTLFAGLFYPFGIPALQILTLLVIVFLSWGLCRLVRLLAKFVQLNSSATHLLAFASLVAFFAIYIAPLRYQSFYWLTGTLPYTFPLITAIWVAVLLGENAISKGRSPYLLPLLGMLAFFGAGFSESGAAFLVAALTLLIAAAFRYRHNAEWARRLKLPIVWTLAWALLAVLILLLSPSSWERAGRYGELAGLFEFIGLTLSFSWDFVRFSLFDLPLPHLALAAAATFLALIRPADIGARRTWIAIGLIALATFVLICASYAPSALIEQNPPHPRTRIIARSTMLFGLALISWLATNEVASHPRLVGLRRPTGLLIGLLSLIYIARALFLVFDLQPVYAQRAEIWDRRDAILLEAAEEGREYVEVQAIDGAPIGGLRDFRDAPGHWINVCAARVYGVGEISGTP